MFGHIFMIEISDLMSVLFNSNDDMRFGEILNELRLFHLKMV